jgi:uncharacterized cupredoxin-like copper-binding protein
MKRNIIYLYFFFTLCMFALIYYGCKTDERPATDMRTTDTVTDRTTDATTGNTIEVTLVDNQINMPATIPAGRTIFKVTNNGTRDHNFEIEGNGIEEELKSDLKPNESGTLEIDLKPGTYTVYCPVGNHKDMGMQMTLTVQ